jgi:hypothetical protein
VRAAERCSPIEELQPASTAAQHRATSTNSRRRRAPVSVRAVPVGGHRCAPSGSRDNCTEVSRLDTRVMVGLAPPRARRQPP